MTASHTQGFTIAELAIVLLLVATLASMSMFAVNKPLQAADNRTAQSSLDMFVSAERTLYRQLDRYTRDPQRIAPHAPNLTILGASTEPTSPSEISVVIDTSDPVRANQPIGAASLSDSGVCFVVRLDPSGPNRGIVYGRFESQAPGTCIATAALTLPAPNHVTGVGEDWQNPALG